MKATVETHDDVSEFFEDKHAIVWAGTSFRVKLYSDKWFVAVLYTLYGFVIRTVKPCVKVSVP